MLLRPLLSSSKGKALKPLLHGNLRRKWRWKGPQRCSFGTAGGVLSRVVKESQSDPGKVIMNIGAIASLSGFMMSDMMRLRILSVVGSGCGITYNLTRKPPQINAVLWGLVLPLLTSTSLPSVSGTPEKISYTHDEMILYTEHFKDWGVDPRQFKKLVDSQGCTFEYVKKGEVIVKASEPLGEVILVHKGEASAEDPTEPPGKGFLYSYRGDGHNGCVIGGTALVDNTVRLKPYPNRIVAAADSVVVRWNTDHLSEVMHQDKDIESAVLHALYVELIQGLRRQRKHKKTKASHQKILNKIEVYEAMVAQAIKNRSNDGILSPRDKREIREYSAKNRIMMLRKSVFWKSLVGLYMTGMMGACMPNWVVS